MGVIEINDSLLEALHVKAAASERLRMNYDLRTTAEDSSQRMLNVMEVGTKVPIHRHLKTSESVVCLKGCLDWVLYEELPSVDTGGPVHDGETAADEKAFAEVARFRICPNGERYGIVSWFMSLLRYLRRRTGSIGSGDRYLNLSNTNLTR